MTLNKFRALVLVLLIAAAVITGVMVAPSTFADGPRPDPGSVKGWVTYTLYPTTYISGTGTTYSASPRQVSGLDASKVAEWNAVDVFLTADISGTTTITLTPQFSPDQSNWADAYWYSISGTTVTAQPYQIVLSADGTNYLRLPVSGEYMRMKMATSGNGVTTTIKATYRNN